METGNITKSVGGYATDFYAERETGNDIVAIPVTVKRGARVLPQEVAIVIRQGKTEPMIILSQVQAMHFASQIIRMVQRIAAEDAKNI